MIKHDFLGISTEGFHHIAYTEWGIPNPNHPAIICVHGYSRNSRDFDSLAKYLSKQGRHVFCPDIPGRGDSDWFKDPHLYNFVQYVCDMNALIARTEYEQIDWIGTSMGGVIGLMLASLPKSPIRHLILNDIGPQIPLHGLKKLNLSGRQYNFKSMDEAVQYFRTQCAEFGHLTDKQWQTFAENSVRKENDNLFVSKLDPNIKHAKSTMQLISDFFHHPHKSLEGILYDVDLWALWKMVHCPVLVIRGEHSDLLTPEIIKKMKRLHKSTQLHEIKDAGHAPALLDKIDHEIINNWLNTI